MANASGGNGGSNGNGGDSGNGAQENPDFEKSFENLEGDTWIQEDEDGESITFGEPVRFG